KLLMEALWRLVEPLVRQVVEAWARRQALPDGEVADHVHEMYFKLPKSLAGYDPSKGAFAAYIRMATDHYMVDAFRRPKSRVPHFSTDLEPPASSGPGELRRFILRGNLPSPGGTSDFNRMLYRVRAACDRARARFSTPRNWAAFLLNNAGG